MTESIDIAEHVSLDCADIYLLGSGIIRYEFREGFVIDVKDIQEMSTTRGKMAGTQKRKILIVTSRYMNITPQARNFDLREHRIKHTLAEAYVITNIATRIATNFYHYFNKPPVPVKVFKTEYDAMDWLNDF